MRTTSFESSRGIFTHPQRIFIKVRWFPLNHLNGHDAQTPDVDLWPILFPSNNLWCHPVGSSNHGATFALLWRYCGTEAKIS